MTEHATEPDEITSRLRLWEHVAATNHDSRSRHLTHLDAAEVARDARLEIERLRKVESTRETINHDSHQPHIKLIGPRHVEYCGRCLAKGPELSEESCNERRYRKRAEHAEQWYGTRLERLNQMAREEFPEELKRRYFNVVANGTADVMEMSGYALEMNSLKHKLEAAVEALRPFADAFREVEVANTATETDHAGYQEMLDKNTITPRGVTMGHFRKAFEFMKVWVKRD